MAKIKTWSQKAFKSPIILFFWVGDDSPSEPPLATLTNVKLFFLKASLFDIVHKLT